MAEEWITTKEASQRSGYNPEYLRRLVRKGKIDGRKFGTIWQVNLASLKCYIVKAAKSSDHRMGPKSG